MKDFMQLAKKRYSCREYSKKAVGVEVIKSVIEAGLVSPSTCNYQPYHLYVVKGDKLKQIQQLQEVGITANAPVGIVLCNELKQTWVRRHDEVDFGLADLAIVAEHMALQAADLGLDSIIVGSYNPIDVSAILSLPDRHYPHLTLMLGYASPEDVPPSPDRHSALRKDPADMVTYL